ncbi:MAG: cupin domain-containing protein, partial [Deltaproteobacteria bacterium]|nr:cupin domain-containing protein [Deltaproteobacteria bacterium]
MIVRNLNDKEVLEQTYIAHGGAIAQMILDRRILKEIGF